MCVLHFAVQYLATLYIEGESTYTIEDEDKITSVFVDRTIYTLNPEAMEVFESIHDDWEVNICEKYPHDVLVGGIIAFYIYFNGILHIVIIMMKVNNSLRNSHLQHNIYIIYHEKSFFLLMISH